jgi:hypothetical protein
MCACASCSHLARCLRHLVLLVVGVLAIGVTTIFHVPLEGTHGKTLGLGASSLADTSSSEEVGAMVLMLYG